MHLELEERHLATLLDLLDRELPKRDVRAFGSRANGKSRPYSDLDLMLMEDLPLSLEDRSRLAEAFDLSDLPFRVDLTAWADAPDWLRDVVQKNGIALQRPNLI
jgi:uncharacterized protein